MITDFRARVQWPCYMNHRDTETQRKEADTHKKQDNQDRQNECLNSLKKTF